MDPDDDVRVMFSQVTNGPPMELDASDVIARGGRVRRRRKRWAVAGSSVATAAVLVVAGLAVGHRAGPTPVEPARPGLSTVAPAPSSPPPAVQAPVDSSSVPAQPPQSQVVPGQNRPEPATTANQPRTQPTPGAPAPPSAVRKPGATTVGPVTAPTALSR
ncbi:hypothetical protein [Amycolatopsis sp. NBC_01480]|jgi:hypothetical protein|uniref:hypothetical protein n=1 Tax=Amycolatopsis sp. NBC_01480 TaxID=2903562 RepID=UPI002E2BC10F|nr:hypothetical protein [Amycolatopsis sp. NBC_01480]